MNHASPINVENLDRAAELLRRANRIAVLTGAGISAESGVPTFRDAGGLWEGQRPEDVATPRAFARDPLLVWRFYNARRKALRTVQPNPGHHALAELERRRPDAFTLITQNVDGLHQLAGSRNVLEIHGSIGRVRCTSCEYIEELASIDLADLPRCERCQSLLRPDVVWFEEMLPEEIWMRADSAARSCDCFLVVGTSAVIYPAAGLIRWARDAGASLIEINVAATDATSIVDVAIQGPSGVVLPELLQHV